MKITEIEAKTVLRKYKNIESWFIARYGMNIYRGCAHNCVYCDGRAEKYQVEGEFGTEIGVKMNAPQLLMKELNTKRKPQRNGFIIPGGGVGDVYQAVERKYELMRQVLKVIFNCNFPVHILTKSTLVERDIDILKQINLRSRVLVSFSLSSTDDKICKLFEFGASAASERLQTIAKLKEQGIACGVLLMPVIPFITDTYEQIDNSLKQIATAGADYVVFGGMTLKIGRQKDYFMNVLQLNYPQLIPQYEIIYGNNSIWGDTLPNYYKSINSIFMDRATFYGIPKRIPARLYSDVIDQNDLVTVILEHIDYLLKLRGQKSSFSYTAHLIAQLQEPISLWRNKLSEINGIGKVSEHIIKEIIETGTCQYYEKLLIE